MKQQKSGFTIVELLVVIVVIGILAAITIIAFNGISQRARVASLQSDLNAASKTIENFKVSSGTDLYPVDAATAGIKASGGNVFTYTVNNSANPASYCVTAVNGTDAYFVANGTQVSQGTCATNNGLVGWWQLNGNANDSSGNNLNGTVTGASLVAGKNGAANGAYTFSSYTHDITFPSSTLLNNAVFSFSAWIKPTSLSTGGFIGSTQGAGPEFRIDTNGKITMVKEAVVGVGTSTGTISAGAWSHVVFTYDAVGNYAFYINGSPAGSGTSLQTFTFSQFRLGMTYIGATSENFPGAIDDVRFYNRTLSASDVTAIYAAGAF